MRIMSGRHVVRHGRWNGTTNNNGSRKRPRTFRPTLCYFQGLAPRQCRLQTSMTTTIHLRYLSSSHTPPNNNQQQTAKQSTTKHKPSQKAEPLQQRSNPGTVWQHWMEQLKRPPNLLTASRILASPILSYWIITNQTVPAILGCSLAALTDGLDGYLARHYQMHTVLGTYLDPLADKILINILSVSLWINGTLPTPVMVVWLGRDLLLTSATYWYVRQHTPHNHPHVMDPSTTPLQVHPTTISKVNTVLQFGTVFLGIIHPLDTSGWLLHTLLPLSYWTTTATTLWSIASYRGHQAFSEVKSPPPSSTTSSEKKEEK